MPFPKLLPHLGQIGLGQILHGRALGDHFMGLILKLDEIGLPEDRGVDVIQLVEQESLPHLLVPFLVHEGIGQDAFPEHRGCFRQREGGMEGKDGMFRRQHAVDGMAELMGHRRDIACLAGEVQQHVWGHAWDDAVTIGAPDFSWPRPRVDMAFMNHPFRQVQLIAERILDRPPAPFGRHPDSDRISAPCDAAHRCDSGSSA